MELKTYKQRVEKVLKMYKRPRNSDWHLLTAYIVMFHPNVTVLNKPGKLSISFDEIHKLPFTMCTLSRARRIIQNVEKKYPPTDEKVIKARGIKEKNYGNIEVREANKQ